jgi:Cd2+/Zn2+-exporting ATPase
MAKEIKISLKGLDCANCANKIETKVNELNEIREATLNFSLGRMALSMSEGINKEDVINKIKKIVNDLEPHVIVSEYKVDKMKRANNKNVLNYDSHFEKTQQCSDVKCISIKCDGHSHHTHNIDIEEHEKNEEHDHEHVHEFEEGGIFRKNIPLIIGIIGYIMASVFENKGNNISIILFLVSYVLVGGEIVMRACKNIIRGEVFDENFLMSIATIGALAIGEYPEAVAVMIFYQIGEVFQGYAVNHSRKSITALMNIRADYANLMTSSGEKKVGPEEVEVEDIIIIKPGERVPLDGMVIEGNGSIDTSALTGESMPREININEEILSGSINLNSIIKVKVSKTFSESTISRILELVENASNKKAPIEKFITKFSRYYTPIVVFSALVVALLPPLLIKDAEFSIWIYRALSFLVVSCPCALVVSIPLGLFSGIGGASRKGILVKGGNYLEALKDVDTVVFDKTGTLTKGSFRVSEINNINISKEELLRFAAIGESFSGHPIAKSIVNEYSKEIKKQEVVNYKELSGYGIKSIIEGKETLLGNYKLMRDNKILCEEIDSIGTVVYIAIEGEYKGSIIIEDEVKEDSKEAIKQLKLLGIKKIVMLTGDNKKVADKVSKELGIDEVYGELLPIDKVFKVEQLIKGKANGKLIFVGDGINDAPVLARADIGIAMGGIGSDAAIEAADVVLMKDNPLSLVDAIKIAKKTSKILWQNIIFSLVIKIGALMIISVGLATMWEAVFADVGVTLIAVLNSMRALKH